MDAVKEDMERVDVTEGNAMNRVNGGRCKNENGVMQPKEEELVEEVTLTRGQSCLVMFLCVTVVIYLHHLHGMSRFFGDMSTFGIMTLC